MFITSYPNLFRFGFFDYICIINLKSSIMCILKLNTSLVDIENYSQTKYRFVIIMENNPERFVTVQKTNDNDEWSNENTNSYDYHDLVETDTIVMGEVVLNYNPNDLIHELHHLHV